MGSRYYQNYGEVCVVILDFSRQGGVGGYAFVVFPDSALRRMPGLYCSLWRYLVSEHWCSLGVKHSISMTLWGFHWREHGQLLFSDSKFEKKLRNYVVKILQQAELVVLSSDNRKKDAVSYVLNIIVRRHFRKVFVVTDTGEVESSCGQYLCNELQARNINAKLKTRFTPLLTIVDYLANVACNYVKLSIMRIVPTTLDDISRTRIVKRIMNGLSHSLSRRVICIF